MDHHMDIDEEDLEPTPLALPHQVVHRVVSNSPNDFVSGNHEDFLRSTDQHGPKISTKRSPADNVISDSDGAGDDGEEDDDFHSAASHDAFQISPDSMDVVFGRGQPLRDHPGNMRMRDIIKRYTGEYRKANKQQKTKLIKQIQEAIAARGTRFLVPYDTQQPLEGCKPATTAEIRGKISHGLRDAIKVEDLLDSEFVQLWSTPEHHSVPPPPPSIPSQIVSPGPNVDIAHMPFHPIGGSMAESAIPSPMSFLSSSVLSAQAPPPLNLGPQQQVPMHFNQQQALMLLQQHAYSSMNGMQSLSYTHQRSPSYLNQSERGSGMGPAIFHISTNHPTDKTEDDDSSTLATMEKGQMSQNRPVPPSPTPVAVNAVLASPHNTCGSKQNRIVWACGIVVVIALVALVVVGFSDRATHRADSDVAAPTNSPTQGLSPQSTLQRILSKGVLNCAVGHQPGYAARNTSTNEVEGMDVELCRAIGAAIFGRESFNGKNRKDEPVEYTFVETQERFQSLASGEVDLLLAATTNTLERQVYEPTTKQSFAFSTPYLVNGLMFAGRPGYVECADTLNITNACQEDLSVCVLSATTHRDVVEDILPDATTVEAPTFDAFLQVYNDGGCNVVAGEQIDVTRIVNAVDTSRMGEAVHSKEPLAIVTRANDSQFSDFVNWVLQSVMAAEELRSSGGSLADLPTPTYFGDRFKFMFHDAVAVVSDYGALYEEHLQKYYPRSDANRINVDTAAMFALPFGKLRPDTLPIVSSDTLGKIRSRGFLKCGITSAAIFAEFDTSINEWTGLDVDFCKAISAAIFDGAVHVRYDVLGPVERFSSLQNGDVDVLARVTTFTMERDVQEATTGIGFTFSPANFFDSIRFGGVPEFVACADSLDYSTGICSELTACVTGGTTQHEILVSLLPTENIRVSAETSANLEAFANGECNTIFGGLVEVVPANAAAVGYTGLFEISASEFSRESLSLVTREDDKTWSDFVETIVTATFFAEEEGITQDTYLKMPRIDLFRPIIGNEMLRHAIRQVGSYSEIWERNASSKGLTRFGRNLLNSLPSLGPQLVSDLLWDQPIYAMR